MPASIFGVTIGNVVAHDGIGRWGVLGGLVGVIVGIGIADGYAGRVTVFGIAGLSTVLFLTVVGWYALFGGD